MKGQDCSEVYYTTILKLFKKREKTKCGFQ